MVLLFLRDWRSALIVVLNIPFALLAAVILLWITGQTINIMTLGGLALAVGVLVDEATVEIENIHTRMLPGRVAGACGGGSVQPYSHGAAALDVLRSRSFRTLLLHGRRGAPAVRATVAGGRIFDDCVVSFIEHPGAGLFDLADARSASWRGAAAEVDLPPLSELGVCDSGGRWRWCTSRARACSSTWFTPRLGTEIFPDVNAPLFRIRLRAPAGTRIEETERIVLHALDVIRETAGSGQYRHHQRLCGRWFPPAIRSTSSTCLPAGRRRRSSRWRLKPDAPRGEASTRTAARESAPGIAGHTDLLRSGRHRVSQVMSFGSPTPVEVAVQGPSLADDYAFGQKVRAQTGELPFLRDLAVRAGTELPDPRHRRSIASARANSV